MKEWREGTVTVSARVDIVAYAKCAVYIELMGQPVRSKSDLLWTLVQMYASYADRKAQETGLGCLPDNVEQAVKVLDRLGLSITGNDRQKRQVARSLQRQVMREDFNMYAQAAQTQVRTKEMLKDELPNNVATFEVFEERMHKMYPELSKMRLYTMYEEEIAMMRKSGTELQPTTSAKGLAPQNVPADMADQVAQAAERQKAERAALAGVPPSVVTAKTDV